MPAIDTIASYQGTSGSSYAAGTMAGGDSNVVRNAPLTSRVHLLQAMYDSVTANEPWRVRSPALVDNVQGIRFWPGETPQQRLLPRQVRQLLQPQDTLTFEFSTAAATGKALGALGIYYEQLPGISARLASHGDIAGNVAYIKPLVITFGLGANTAGAWYDLVATTTENLLEANTDFAVLGYTVDTGVAAVAIKGVETGNLRVGGPGIVQGDETTEYFVMLSQDTGLPCIPVINSANIGNVYGSIISSAATAAAVDLVFYLAQLAHNLPA